MWVVNTIELNTTKTQTAHTSEAVHTNNSFVDVYYVFLPFMVNKTLVYIYTYFARIIYEDDDIANNSCCCTRNRYDRSISDSAILTTNQNGSSCLLPHLSESAAAMDFVHSRWRSERFHRCRRSAAWSMTACSQYTLRGTPLQHLP